MLQKFKTEIKWAFIFIAILLIWSVLERLLGFHDKYIGNHPTMSSFFMIPAIIVFALALRDKKKTDFNGTATYKELLISGLIISFIIAVFSPLTQLLISKVISPDYFENAINYSVESGNATKEEAVAYFNYTSYAIQGPIFSIAMGLVTSAILAIFIRSKQ